MPVPPPTASVVIIYIFAFLVILGPPAVFVLYEVVRVFRLQPKRKPRIHLSAIAAIVLIMAGVIRLVSDRSSAIGVLNNNTAYIKSVLPAYLKHPLSEESPIWKASCIVHPSKGPVWPLHEYLYLYGPPTNDNATSCAIRQFVIQSDGSLRWMSPPSFSAGDTTGLMAVDSQRRTAYVTLFADSDISYVCPYRVRDNGTLRPLLRQRLNFTEDVHDIFSDPRHHYLFVFTDTLDRYTQEESRIWYRYRIRRDGGLSLPPTRFTKPPLLPETNGFVYDTWPPFVDISQVAQNGALQHTVRQQIMPSSPEYLSTQLTVLPTGRFAYLNLDDRGPLSAYRIGKEGQLTLLSDQATASMAVAYVCADPSGRFLYVFDAQDVRMNAYRIGHDGLLTLRQSFRVGPPGDFFSMNIVQIPQKRQKL